MEVINFSEGWDFLIDKYRYDVLYEIDKVSGWFDRDLIQII